MRREEIMRRLEALRDDEYAQFTRRLIPETDKPILGARTPELRALAKEAAKQEDTAGFLSALPHAYFEENQLHAFILSEEKDFDRCMAGVEAFLPFVDNWATCDQMLPGCFGKRLSALREHIRAWLVSSHPYTVRFGLRMLMKFFLGDSFDPADLDAAASLRSDHYYVNMMVAWYFAEALAKQPEAAMPYLEGKKLPPWTHNKAIQKAKESRRIPEDTKRILDAMRLRAGPAEKYGK